VEAARGRKRGLQRRWGRDETMRAVCGEGVAEQSIGTCMKSMLKPEAR
jgi:hypothetical protein